jgi:hypothetical protein
MDIVTRVSAYMTYEHKDSNGKVISRGTLHKRRFGKLQFVQETGKGVKQYESLQSEDDGTMLEEKFYEEGKEIEHFTYSYDKQGNLFSVKDKKGIVSVNPELVEKDTITE